MIHTCWAEGGLRHCGLHARRERAGRGGGVGAGRRERRQRHEVSGCGPPSGRRPGTASSPPCTCDGTACEVRHRLLTWAAGSMAAAVSRRFLVRPYQAGVNAILSKWVLFCTGIAVHVRMVCPCQGADEVHDRGKRRQAPHGMTPADHLNCDAAAA